MGQMMECINPFYEETKKGSVFVFAGEILDSDHEIVKRHPESFKAHESRFETEAATAAPGEKRAARAKKPSATDG